MNKALKGIYIHIPFCESKCPYCDFYSTAPSPEAVESYVYAVLSELENLERTAEIYPDIKNADLKSDTLYIGGGTPSLIGGERLSRIVRLCRELYLTADAEITVECNPHSSSSELFEALAKAGVNRISLGMQSANDTERKLLGRRSGADAVLKAVNAAKSCGIDNISLDLMLGIPNQSAESLKRSVDFCAHAGAKHISAYILSLEEGTPFFKLRDSLKLPDEDETCEIYMEACEYAESLGYGQYEISNFALPGFESRHNLKYWSCEEYLGIGSASHSLFGSHRWFFSRSVDDFINKMPPVPDGEGDTEYEYAMLRLRLKDGLTYEGFRKHFGHELPARISEKSQSKVYRGLVEADTVRIALTRKGFLVSNAIIGDLIDCLY
ncbi:MAG: radical SAM family heme chaperone HemW [Clostridiales bacterium]|nr:radical SAM family heme chaperone HemW [Clostridiales bacterium]